MASLRAVIFDLDGTLVDSARDLQEAMNALLAEENLRPISLNEVKAMVGDGAAKLVERALVATGGDASRLPSLVGRFLEIYEADTARYTEAYPGVRETLENLSRMDLLLAVVTNKPYAATADILEQLGLSGFFQTVIGGDTLPQRKPDPAPVLLALERLGVEAEAALMVGDNYHDVQAARAAGVRAFAVTYGYSHKPHAELGAEQLLDSMSELLPYAEAAIAA